MKILNNPELKKALFLQISAGIIFCLIGLFIGSLLFAGITFLICTFYISVYICSAKKRYSAISDLSLSIDKILHGQEQILLTDSSEGELSILKSEIQKMTVRLKESTDSLKGDKILLTDAIADISHQLRTPLTSMNLTVSMLLSEDLTSERRISLSHNLKKSLQRIDWLIESLLKISKIDSGTASFKHQTVLVSDILKKSTEPFEVAMELKNQKLKMSVQNEKYTGDEDWSIEAFSNLIKNCIEHTSEGGIIEIIARETAIFTEVIIKDNGNGFDEKDIPYLFKRFYKGKNSSSESVGIGLALSRMAIIQQNGTITAKNRAEGGAEFIVRFYKVTV